MISTVQNGLRRIDAVAAKRAHIAILPFGIFLRCKRIRPAEIIPVVDMVGETDDIALLDHLAQSLVRRRARRASLRCEQFNDALHCLLRMRGCDEERAEKTYRQGEFQWHYKNLCPARYPDELMRSILPGCKPENNVYSPSIESHEGVSGNHKKQTKKQERRRDFSRRLLLVYA